MPLPPAITSRANPRVKALRAALSGAATRAGELLGVEGLHMVGELHKSGQSFEAIYLREGSESILEQGWPAQLRTAAWVLLARDVFDSAVTTVTPQGIAAIWAIREPALPARQGNVLLLENLQDPGNLGTLIRSAEAFGFGQIMVTATTANQWNPKVVRASAGSVFRLPVQRAPMETLAATLRAGGVRMFAAVSELLRGGALGVPAMAAPHGVLTGGAASPVAVAANGSNGRATSVKAGSYAAALSPDADFIEPCAILVGNEGAGLSDLARSLADEQVLIPCHAESLNAAVAGSVLMYEVIRQAPLRRWAREQGLRP